MVGDPFGRERDGEVEGGAASGAVGTSEGYVAGVVVDADGEAVFGIGVGGFPGEDEVVAGEGGGVGNVGRERSAGDEDARGIDGKVGEDSVVVNLVEEVGTREVVGLVVAVAEGVGLAEGGDERGDECETLAMGLLGRSARVSHGRRHGAEVAVSADVVADEIADVTGEVDYGTVGGHGDLMLICLMLIC